MGVGVVVVAVAQEKSWQGGVSVDFNGEVLDSRTLQVAGIVSPTYSQKWRNRYM